MDLPIGYVNNNNSLNNFSSYSLSEKELKKYYKQCKRSEYKGLRIFLWVCFIVQIVGFSSLFAFDIFENLIGKLLLYTSAFAFALWLLFGLTYLVLLMQQDDMVLFMLSIASKEVKSGVSLSKGTTATSTDTNSAVTYYLLVDNYGDAFLCKNEGLYNKIEPNVNYFVVMNKNTHLIHSVIKVNS